MMRLTLVCFLMLCAGVAFAAGSSSKKTVVAYVIAGEGMNAEDSAAVTWLNSHTVFVCRTSVVKPAAWTVPSCDVLWLHAPDLPSYRRLTGEPSVMRALKGFVSNGGSVLATDYAAFLPSDLGAEPVRPSVRFDTLQNDWLWDKKGYHSHRGHPLLHGLFGGDYVWDATVDQVLPVVGYFGDQWPARGKVVGVEKSYVFLHAERKIAISHGFGKGRILSLGGLVYLGRENHLRANLEQLLQNALLYLRGDSFGEPETIWEKPEALPREIKVISPPLKVSPEAQLPPAGLADMVLTRDSAAGDWFDVAGRRALMMGKEKGGLDEVWVHPIRIMRDYQAGVVSGDSVRWLQDLAPSVSVHPASFTRTYKLDGFVLKETLFPGLKHAGGVARYESTAPVRLVVRFRSDLRWMWPFDAMALGTLHYGYDPGLQALHVRDKTGSFACMFGADANPRAVLTGHFERVEWKAGRLAGTPTAEHQVAFGAEYAVGSEGGRALTFAFAGTNEGTEACERDYRALVGSPASVFGELKDHYTALLDRSASISTPDEEFNTLYKWAIVGTDRFVAYTPGVGTGLLAGFSTTARGWNGAHKISGRPGSAWYFGRDAAWSGFAVDAYGDFETVRHQLELYQTYQDRSGKIFHELSTSGVVHFDASDATPMYVMLAAHYLRASGDSAFIRRSWPHIKKAMDFLASTDTDGDGLIENTDVGHGWVEPGGVLFGVHSEYYLAVLWAKALEDAAALSVIAGKPELQAPYRAKAAEVRSKLNRDFWLPEQKFFSHGKLKDGSFAGERTVFPAVGLMYGMVDDARAPELLRAYASSAFSTDWGVRALSGESRYFNPRSYQEGAAWPLFTGWTALGEFQYGNSVQGFTHIKELMLVKNRWALGFVEEVLHGSVCRPSGVCFHQCWSETNILHPALEGLVGWKPNAPEGTAELSPRFPADWDSVSVRRLRVGSTLLDMEIHRQASRTVYSFRKETGSGCTVSLAPEIPAGTRIGRVLVNGVPLVREYDITHGLLATPVEVRVEDPATVVFEYSDGVALSPVIPRPLPGDSTQWHRILYSSWAAGALSIEVEGRGGTTGVFPFRVFGSQIPAAAGAEVRRGKREGEWELVVAFEGSDRRFVKQALTIQVK
ncbi:MAG: hypothetical protein IT282_10740 [Bacteroidetes bacterium]|nr:hypothetical protein [Bacteroidota bacterium]